MNAIAEKIHLIERITRNDEATLRMLDKVIDFLVEKDRKKLEGFREKFSGIRAAIRHEHR